MPFRRNAIAKACSKKKKYRELWWFQSITIFCFLHCTVFSWIFFLSRLCLPLLSSFFSQSQQEIKGEHYKAEKRRLGHTRKLKVQMMTGKYPRQKDFYSYLCRLLVLVASCQFTYLSASSLLHSLLVFCFNIQQVVTAAIQLTDWLRRCEKEEERPIAATAVNYLAKSR